MITLVVQRPGASPEPTALAGAARAGGSLADDVHLPGCPPGAVRLIPCAAGVVVEAVAAGVRAAGHPLPPGGRRLLRPGERAELHGAALALEHPAPDAPTRALAAKLLRAAAAGRAPPGPHLVILSGPSAGHRVPLRSEQTLGRGRGADVVLPDPRASRVHARVRVGPGGATVEDLRSKNGLRVNGVRVDRGPIPIRAGDELLLGDTRVAVDLGAGDAAGALPRSGPEPSAPPPPGRRGRAAAVALLALSAAALALAAS